MITAALLRHKWVLFRSGIREVCDEWESMSKANFLAQLALTASEERIRQQQRAHAAELDAMRQEGFTLTNRIDRALEELVRSKGAWSGHEEAYAIVLSPYQAERFNLTNHWNRWTSVPTAHAEFCDEHGVPIVAMYSGLPILVAKGVYGPVIVTATALAAISRNAPELVIHGANKR